MQNKTAVFHLLLQFQPRKRKIATVVFVFWNILYTTDEHKKILIAVIHSVCICYSYSCCCCCNEQLWKHLFNNVIRSDIRIGSFPCSYYNLLIVYPFNGFHCELNKNINISTDWYIDC